MENFFNNKIMLRAQRGYYGDSVIVTLGDCIAKVPTDTGPLSFLPPSDEFTMSVAASPDTYHYTIRRTEQALIVSSVKAGTDLRHCDTILRIPQQYKNHLYWVTFHERFAGSYDSIRRSLDVTLDSLGAEFINLPPGNYGHFFISQDSLLRIKGVPAAYDDPWPVLFYYYPGPQEWFLQAAERVAARLRTTRRPPEHLILFCDPSYRMIAGSRETWAEIPDRAAKVSQTYLATITKGMQTGQFIIRPRARAFLAGEHCQISCEVRETDDGIYIRTAPVMLIDRPEPPRKPDSGSFGGSCTFLPPSDTFDLYFVEAADTARFTILTDDKRVRVIHRSGSLVEFRDTSFARPPQNMFWFSWRDYQSPRDLTAYIEKAISTLGKLGAELCVVDSDLYCIPLSNSGSDLYHIHTGSYNRYEYGPILFFRYDGPEEPIREVVTTQLVLRRSSRDKFIVRPVFGRLPRGQPLVCRRR